MRSPGFRSPLVLLLAGLVLALAPAAPGHAATAPIPSPPAAKAPLTARLSAPAVAVGTGAAVTGTTAPGRAVVLERQSRSTWRTLASGRASAAGSFRFPVTPTAPGWWRYRVTTPVSGGQPAEAVVLPPLDAYRLHTWVLARRGAPVGDLGAFATTVAAAYADPRGWSAAHHRFQRVASGGDFTVVLAEARRVPSFSPSCSVQYSCRVGRYVVLNEDRFRTGSAPFSGGLAQYRSMVVNHETGHWLGLGHASCPRSGALAPVMQQQSKGTRGCRPNAWPLAQELAAVS